MKNQLLLLTLWLCTHAYAGWYECRLSFSDTSYAYRVNLATYYTLDDGKRLNTLVLSYGEKEYDSGQGFYGTGEFVGKSELFRSFHLAGAKALFDAGSAAQTKKLVLKYPGEHSEYTCSLLK